MESEATFEGEVDALSAFFHSPPPFFLLNLQCLIKQF